MRYFAITVALLFVLTGCREEIASVDPITNDDPPTSEVQSLYMKGPGEIAVGSNTRYRAELLLDDNLDVYEWGVIGDGRISAYPSDPSGLDRIVQVQALEAGTVTLYARAFSSEGETIGYSQRTIQITQ